MGPEGTARSQLSVVDAEAPLIADDEGPPVEIIGGHSPADIVLICEHASNVVPRSLNALGLDLAVLESHVAWDPGAAAVARSLAQSLAAPLVLQRFSRLVYDCNRPPTAESAMPARSEIFDIPGNADLDDDTRAARVEALYGPFRKAVAAVIDRQMTGNRAMTAGAAPAVVTVHSFTPVFHGKHRSVELGLLHDTDTRLADAMLEISSGWSDLEIQRNEPYGPEDGVTHTLQVDAIARGLPNVMIEIRNDLIATPDQQTMMAARLAPLIGEAVRKLSPVEDTPSSATLVRRRTVR